MKEQDKRDGISNRVTPTNVTKLEPNEIFVFGSNKMGMHLGGAARYAYENFGAEWGNGEGLQGRTYALPTMEGKDNFVNAVKKFTTFAKEHTELLFLVTPVGCGIAGYTTEEVAPMFLEAASLPNVHLPEDFWRVIQKQQGHMKTYLEIKVPISYDDCWFHELREALKDRPVHWQKDYYHITMAFLDETRNLPEIKAIMHKYLDDANAVPITFDKLDVFATNNGMLIVHLTASRIPETFQNLVNSIRGEILLTSSNIQSDFRLHVTLGRIFESGADIDDIGFLLNEITLPPLALTLNEVEYRVFRGKSIYNNRLQTR